MSNDNGHDPAFKKSLQCDLLNVQVSGPDPEWVEAEFDDAVEQAFDRYEQHVRQEGDRI